MAKEKEKPPVVELTSIEILGRVFGWGEAQSITLLAKVSLTDQQLRTAYALGAGAVFELLDKAVDAAANAAKQDSHIKPE